MIQYLIIVFVIIFSGVIINTSSLNNQSKRKAILIISSVTLIFFSSFRAENIGGDLGNYLPWFDEASRMNFSLYLERMNKNGGKLFFVFNYILSQINTSRTFYLFATSVFILISVSIFIKRYSKYIWLSFIIFICMGYFNNTLNNVRSSCAYAIILFAYPYIIDRKFYKFLLIYFIAILFHSSVFPFIIAYFLVNKKINLYATVSVGLAGYVVMRYISGLLLAMMALYSARYAYADILFSNSSGISLFLLLVIILVFCSVYLKKDSTKSILFYNIFSIAIWLQPLASVAGNLNRLTQIFAYAVMILLPNSIANIRNKNLRSLVITIVVGLLIVYYIQFILKVNPITGTNISATVPYKFIWE